MYLTVRQLETLVADPASFSEAAAKLGISHLSLSERIGSSPRVRGTRGEGLAGEEVVVVRDLRFIPGSSLTSPDLD